jgi:predicted RNase H-like HicB family nuclease/predicted RNA binding protein YcfA (HicA-like mRNA interferase family)
MKLLVTLEPDETGMIVAECPAIPGCVSQGNTEAEAMENIREAIAGCLEARSANGMPLTIEVREVEGPAWWRDCPRFQGSELFGLSRRRWSKDRQHGSHVILLKPGNPTSLSVPQHREVAPGTLRSLIRASGMTVAQFVDLVWPVG